MANKKIYFYKLNLFETKTSKEHNISELKKDITDIVDLHSTDNGGYKTLDLTIDFDESMHMMMDIFSYKSDILFCRLSKQKPNNSLIKRNYITKKSDNVLQPIELENNGIEIFTFGLINYRLGIYSFVNTQSAPNEKIIGNIFTKFKNEFYIEMQSIPNPEGINTIYFGNDPEVSKIEVEIPVPEADILDKVFQWEENDITDVIVRNGMKAVITISAPSRGRLVDNEEAVGLIDIIKASLDSYRKAKMTARASGVESKEYDFREKYFSFPTEIRKSHKVDGKMVEYTDIELTDIYRKKLSDSFQKNMVILSNLTGRHI